jgi:hypothetical protein
MEKATFRTWCLVFLLISTNLFSQSDPDDVTGVVLYQDDYPMSGTTAYLHSSAGDIIATDITDNQGYYEFLDLVPGNYTVTFSSEQPAGGVELSDADLLLQFLDGECTFTPIQELAADVNGNGVINMGDYNHILNGYLNQNNPFPIGPWVFETLSVTIPNTSRDGFISKSGSSSGDVNGTLTPDPKTNPIFLDNPVIDVTQAPSDPIDFELKGGQNLLIAGMHLVINVPDGLDIIGVESAISQAGIYISGQQIRVTWLDETMQGFDITEGNPLLVIRSEAKGSSRNRNSYSLKMSDESHFMNTDGKLLSGVSLELPSINVTLQDNMSLSAYPNPFLNNITFDYSLPEDGHVTIDLFDRTGRKVMELENSPRAAGSHQVRIDGSVLLPGVYYYSIKYSGSKHFIDSGSIIKSI